MKIRLIHLLVACILCAPSVALATSIPIVSISNSDPLPGGGAVESTQYLQATWSQSGSYSNVDISAWIFGTFGGPSQVPATAYLTSSSLATPLEASFKFSARCPYRPIAVFGSHFVCWHIPSHPCNHIRLWRWLGRQLGKRWRCDNSPSARRNPRHHSLHPLWRSKSGRSTREHLRPRES